MPLPLPLQSRIEPTRAFVQDSGKRLEWLVLFLVRLTVGVVFLTSGWGKLHSLESVTGFFTTLGLPAPAFQARMVATTEFVGGVLMIAGLFARIAAVPLMITMVVAILTAKVGELKTATSLFGFDEYAYLVLFAVIAAFGPGRLSVDAGLVRVLGIKPAPLAPGSLWIRVQTAVVAGFAVALLAFTGWAAWFDHNPCDRLGAGEFTDIVQKSHGTDDDADQAWQTCKQILTWKKEGKDPQAELKKAEEAAP